MNSFVLLPATTESHQSAYDSNLVFHISSGTSVVPTNTRAQPLCPYTTPVTIVLLCTGVIIPENINMNFATLRAAHSKYMIKILARY